MTTCDYYCSMHQWLRISGGIVVSVYLFLGNTVTMSVDMLDMLDSDEQKYEVIT